MTETTPTTTTTNSAAAAPSPLTTALENVVAVQNQIVVQPNGSIYVTYTLSSNKNGVPKTLADKPFTIAPEQAQLLLETEGEPGKSAYQSFKEAVNAHVATRADWFE